MSRSIIADGWDLTQLDTLYDSLTPETLRSLDAPDRVWYPAGAMPAQVHDILLRNGVIDEPWLPGKAEEYQWIGRQDWVYRTTFTLDGGGSLRGTAAAPGIPIRYLLDAPGLDTIADIYVDGVLVAECRNVFISHRIDITRAVMPSHMVGGITTNHELVIHFKSAWKYMEDQPVPEGWYGELDRTAVIRKMGNDFREYLGQKPHFVRVGIFREIYLEEVAGIDITDWKSTTRLSSDLQEGHVEFEFTGSVLMGDDSQKSQQILAAVYAPDGREIATRMLPVLPSDVGQGAATDTILATCRIDIPQPLLWWPAGYGDQALYTVSYSIIEQTAQGSDGSGPHQPTILWTGMRSVGFRTIELVEPFRFIVNGRPVRLWGADFSVFSMVSLCWDQQRMDRLWALAETSHFNAMRVWAETGPLADAFYDEADRRGILLWQDFNTDHQLPEDETFTRIYWEEAAWMVRRLRNHPSILLWCGGNESLMWHDMLRVEVPYIGTRILAEVFAEVCRELDPDRVYWVNSPSGGRYPNDPTVGNTHGYTNMYFVPGYDSIAFAAEDTRICAPPVRSLRRFMRPEDVWPDGTLLRWNRDAVYPWPKSWLDYTTCFSWQKLGPVEEFYEPDSVEELVYRLGAAEGLYYQRTIERQRRGYVIPGSTAVERFCGGYIYWKFNDSWPQIYSSKVDYFLEPNIAYYAIARAYAPILLSIDVGNLITIWLVNDTPRQVKGKVTVRLVHLQLGTVVKSCEFPVSVEPDGSILVTDLWDEFGSFSLDHIIQAELRLDDGSLAARASALTKMERYTKFPDPHLTLTQTGPDTVEITTDRYARGICLEGDADGDVFGWLFDDNYFDLFPFERKEIRIVGHHDHGIISARGSYGTAVTTLHWSRGWRSYGG